MSIAVDLSNDPIVVGTLSAFQQLPLPKQIGELDDLDNMVLAARGSAGGRIENQTAEQSDAILAGMRATVNGQLPQPLDLLTAQTLDIVDAAKAFVRSGR